MFSKIDLALVSTVLAPGANCWQPQAPRKPVAVTQQSQKSDEINPSKDIKGTTVYMRTTTTKSQNHQVAWQKRAAKAPETKMKVANWSILSEILFRKLEEKLLKYNW